MQRATRFTSPGDVHSPCDTSAFRPPLRLGILICLLALTLPGGAHAQSNGTVLAWGDNFSGQLGDGLVEVIRNYPDQTASLRDAVAVAAGGYHSLALKADGTVWAWGGNDAGQCGASETDLSNGLPVPVPVLDENGKEALLSGVVAVAAGYQHSMALKADGTVWAWGSSWNGQLGVDELFPHPYPVQVRGPEGAGYLTDVIAIACGSFHSLAVKSDGTVWAWGFNGNGQLGDNYAHLSPPYYGSPFPVQVVGTGAGGGDLTGVAGVAAGSGHSLAVKSDGTVWAWGFNGNGQLGSGTFASPFDPGTPTPAPVYDLFGPLTGIKSVACGDSHSLALDAHGTVWAWGNDINGQLDGGSMSTNLAGPVYDGQGTFDRSPVVSVVGGGCHTVALRADGIVVTWGNNDLGQLGRNIWGDLRAPGAVWGGSHCAAIAGGFVDSLAIVRAGAFLSGAITLAGCVSKAQRLACEFRPDDGSGVFTRTLALDSDGCFGLPDVPKKSYTLRIKGGRWLAKNLAADLSGGDVSGVNVTLIPGDIDNDNRVSLADLGLLADAFNTTPASPRWNANADLNCDGRVTIVDLGLLADGFGKSGDP